MRTLTELFLLMVLAYTLTELSYMPKWFISEWRKLNKKAA